MGISSRIGPLHMHSKKAGAVFPEREIEDADTNSLMDEGSDPYKSTWLSSDCMSPLLSYSDQELPDVWDIDQRGILTDQKFPSILSALESCESCLNKSTIFDGSQIKHIDEARFVLDHIMEHIDKASREDLRDEKIPTRPDKSPGGEMQDSPMTCYETAESSYDPSVNDESSVFESCSTSISTAEDSSSAQFWDYDRTGEWVSLLDLEGDDSELLPDTVQGFDVFSEPGFPSPKQTVELVSSFNRSEGQIECSEIDEPLFWPFDPSSCYYPSVEWDGFCISPRRDGPITDKPGQFYSKNSIRLRLLKRNNSLHRRKVQGDAESIVFGSPERTSFSNSTTRVIRKITTEPSRLASSTRGHPSEQHSCHVMKKGALLVKDCPPVNGNCRENPRKLKPNGQPQGNLGVSGDSSQQLFMSNIEVPIETQVGLSEFDGHEGIVDMEEADCDQFCLELDVPQSIDRERNFCPN